MQWTPWQRGVLIGLCSMGLVLMYLMWQHVDYVDLLGLPVTPPNARFAINKYVRYLINDGLTIGLIWGLFLSRKYLRFTVWVLLFGLVVLVPTYLLLRMYAGAGLSNYLMYLHRITFNPVIMMLLIPAFYYQRALGKQRIDA